ARPDLRCLMQAAAAEGILFVSLVGCHTAAKSRIEDRPLSNSWLDIRSSVHRQSEWVDRVFPASAGLPQKQRRRAKQRVPHSCAQWAENEWRCFPRGRTRQTPS